MNITPAQLFAQYERAREYAGDLISSINREFNFLPYLLYAIASRETNLDPYYLTHTGDGGHGHGWWQIDDRSHDIPDDWSTNIEWQCRRGAEILRAAIDRCGSVEGGCNAYNSGRCHASATTGEDYGPDVMERRAWLEEEYGAEGEGGGGVGTLTGWQEIDRYLTQQGIAINLPPEPWQTTGGTHATTSWHYKGMARDYSAGMGCDETTIAKVLRQFAEFGGPIIELFHAPTNTWLSNGSYVPGVGGHTDHVHVAIAPGQSLPYEEDELSEVADLVRDLHAYMSNTRKPVPGGLDERERFAADFLQELKGVITEGGDGDQGEGQRRLVAAIQAQRYYVDVSNQLISLFAGLDPSGGKSAEKGVAELIRIFKKVGA